MRVVIATDGSAAARLGVDLAACVDWPADSSIRVVEAIESGVGLFGGPWPWLHDRHTEPLEADLWRRAAETVEAERCRLVRRGLDVRGNVVQGRPASAIVDAARKGKADLIVVGSRGHGTIESMLLGSVSAEVIDRAPVPVLVARDRSIDRIVLGWDGSACGRTAAELVATWPIFSRSSVHVVTVADTEMPWWNGFPGPGSPESMQSYADAARDSRRAIDALAADMAGELAAGGLDAVAERREGDAATELIAAAQASRADLIVVGTHGRTGLARLVLGSVARNVLHHASCSVLVVRG
jgi:nucleotide-binding universal stress UspA family protein